MSSLKVNAGLKDISAETLLCQKCCGVIDRRPIAADYVVSFGNRRSPVPQHSKAALSLEGWSDFAVEFQDKKLTVIAFMGTISHPGQSAHVSGERLFVRGVLFGFFWCALSPSCSNNLLIVS